MSSAIRDNMTLRQYYIGQAMANPKICTGETSPYYADRWFGKTASYDKYDIMVAQAKEFADRMMKKL